MKVLITGASGLIGRHTVAQLLSRGDRVVTFQRSAATDLWLRHSPADFTWTPNDQLDHRAADPTWAPSDAGPEHRASDPTGTRLDTSGPADLLRTPMDPQLGHEAGDVTDATDAQREDGRAAARRPARPGRRHRSGQQPNGGSAAVTITGGPSGARLEDNAPDRTGGPSEAGVDLTGARTQTELEHRPGGGRLERIPGQATRAPTEARVEYFRGDVTRDLSALCRAAAGCAAIVHLAGRGDVAESRRDPVGYAELNATGTLHALEAARANQATFVLASSQRVYPLQARRCSEDEPPAPDSPYGYAKWVAELWCRMASEQFGVTTRVLRLFSVYGPGQQPNGGSGVVTIFARAALAGEPLRVQSAGRRDFTDARDVARAIQLAIDLPPDGMHRVYNVATGVGTSFRELAELTRELSGSRSPIQEHIEEPAGRDLVANIGRARAELDYSPSIRLRDGLARYLAWLQHEAP